LSPPPRNTKTTPKKKKRETAKLNSSPRKRRPTPDLRKTLLKSLFTQKAAPDTGEAEAELEADMPSTQPLAHPTSRRLLIFQEARNPANTAETVYLPVNKLGLPICGDGPELPSILELPLRILRVFTEIFNQPKYKGWYVCFFFVYFFLFSPLGAGLHGLICFSFWQGCSSCRAIS
jgi:hypothetical protein